MGVCFSILLVLLDLQLHIALWYHYIFIILEDTFLTFQTLIEVVVKQVSDNYTIVEHTRLSPQSDLDFSVNYNCLYMVPTVIDYNPLVNILNSLVFIFTLSSLNALVWITGIIYYCTKDYFKTCSKWIDVVEPWVLIQPVIFIHEAHKIKRLHLIPITTLHWFIIGIIIGWKWWHWLRVFNSVNAW